MGPITTIYKVNKFFLYSKCTKLMTTRQFSDFHIISKFLNIQHKTPMKKILKVAGYLIGALVLFLVIAFAFLQFGFPKVDPSPELSIDYTQERIERGAYLANHVTVCMDCHSSRDFSQFSGPPTPGTLGA
jgi:mono/diheme cytochrome c family protein